MDGIQSWLTVLAVLGLCSAAFYAGILVGRGQGFSKGRLYVCEYKRRRDEAALKLNAQRVADN